MTQVAAIDCGTNSIRLLIANVDEAGRINDVVRIMRIVRLGQGVDRTGEFHVEALERTFGACEEFRDIIAQHRVERIRFVATSATRDAANRNLFIDGVVKRLGVTPEVISGAEEANLSFQGAVSALAPDVARPVLVVDIGGGSTEFVLGAQAPQSSISVDMGCVRMTERHFADQAPTPERIAALRHDVQHILRQVEAAVPLAEAQTMVGLAGTVTTVAAMILDLTEYDPDVLHGCWISAEQIHDAATRLSEMSREERAALGFMHPGRVDVIAGGALVLDEICHAVKLPGVIVSEHDILDGIALSCTSFIAHPPPPA
jgi:exopolyphosphatase/guanosine-5'-triphosphate,3'-diphosphate pyrophosphatase